MSIEAMKQVLEVLNNNRRKHYSCEDSWYSCPKDEDGCANDQAGDDCTCGADKSNVEIDAAIAALQQAIEEAEKQEPDDLTIAYMSGFHAGKNTPQPKPEQEPVTLQVNGIPPFKNPPGDVIDSAFHVSDWAKSNNWVKWRIGDCCSVDCTAPPKREWQGLTDEDMAEIWENKGWYVTMFKAVEAKLREKNGC
jgi:hypothetical protein